MFDLPEHLSTLNAVTPSPSSAPSLDPSAEAAVWDYLNTDEMFSNFGVQPSELNNNPSKLSSSAPNDDKKPSPAAALPADLQSFVEQFASDNSAAFGSVNDFSALGFNFNLAPSAAAAPAGINTTDLLPQSSSTPATSVSPWESTTTTDEGRPSGAKKLKSMGATKPELEEDKRRRNTEASARFRQKKKEREQKVEARNKELEGQVAKLQSEKASLENENQLLKTIVLGFTNGSASTSTLDLAQILGKRQRD